jgi:hypothetical protein
MDRVIRDGKVAVLVSPGYGAGWYTWNMSHPSILFDPKIVDMVLSNAEVREIEVYVDQTYGEDEIYTGGVGDLVIRWVPKGARFRINEYDGSESLVLESDEQWITA